MVKTLHVISALTEPNRKLDPLKVRALLSSLARCSAQEASLATLLADVQDRGLKISDPTLRVYLNALRRLYVITDIEAWAPNLRSKTPLRKARVWHLCDPSLAAAALGCNAQGLLNDLNTMGYLFETLCVRDLRVYARPLGGGESITIGTRTASRLMPSSSSMMGAGLA